MQETFVRLPDENQRLPGMGKITESRPVLQFLFIFAQR
jgi:hypothetical protein